MSRRARWTCVPLAASLLALLVMEVPGFCADGKRSPAAYVQDTDVFRLILQRQEYSFVHSFDELDDPAKSLVVILGDVDVVHTGDFVRYIRLGGAALIASDRAAGHSGEGVLGRFGIAVNGGYLWQDLNPENAYRHAAHCPFVEPSPGDRFGLFSGLTAPGEMPPRSNVATNLPSYLQVQGANLLTPIAWLPAQCNRTESAKPPRPDTAAIRLRASPLFAVAGDVGRGRLLVMADQSIFINVMMQQADNGNLLFASRCVSWLNEAGKRKQVYFLDNGVPRDASDINLQTLPTPPMPTPPSADTILGMVDPILNEFEEKDLLNSTLVNWVPPDRMRRWLLYLLTGGLVFYGLSRLRKGRHHVDPNTPLLATAVARATPSDSPVEQRHRALLASGNLWEPARLLSRQFFETMVGPHVLDPKSQVAGRLRLPPFEVNRRGLSGWMLGQRVRRLWRFANVAAPQTVSLRQFRKLRGRIDGLKDAARQGVLRFSSPIQSASR
jgi:hypothetical protein